VSAFTPHTDWIHAFAGFDRRKRVTSLAPIAFHSVTPSATLISTDDLGAASYISPPP
jgi:hypothetical protein